MHFEEIIYEKSAGVARLTINRPHKHNAFTLRTLAEMTAAFEDTDVDETIGVAVLTGAGDKAFCSGGDVGMEEAFNPASGRALVRADMKLSAIMRNMGKPIIGRINGYAIGSGNCLNLLCDLSIASETAKLGQIGPQVGSIPVWISTQMLPRVVGEKKAREIVFLCRQYTAQEAMDMGLVNKVVSADQLDAAVQEWCDRILELSPTAIRVAKLNLNYGSDLTYPALVHGMEMLALTYGSDEALEGMRAFLEKRPKDFSRFRAPKEYQLPDAPKS